MEGNSDRCLKWGDGGGGVIKESLPKQINGVKEEIGRKGEGILKVSPPLPPIKI